MPGICRQGDISTGHGSFPPQANVAASSNVFVNGKGVVRVGDVWAGHCNPVPVCHGTTSNAGSSTVTVNGKGVVRIGDGLSCGDTVAGGSGNVKAG